MNNGGGEGGSQRRELEGKRKLFRGNDFAFATAKMAVAQICESVEINTYQEPQTREGVRFSSFQESALDKLTDVAIRYIQSIGKTAHSHSNLAGRVESNSLDIVQALEDLGFGLGFTGASGTNYCLADSGVVKDIIRYTGEAEEMPFVYSLPRFPFNKGKKPVSSFSGVGVEPPDEHIPVWLPVFPETKLYIQSEDTSVGRNERNTECRENELPSSSLQHNFCGDKDRLEADKSVVQNNVQKSTEGEVGNPFLVAPLRFVEKEISPVFRPLELSNEAVSINHVPENHMSNNHHIPVLEAPLPSDEINDKNRLTDSVDGEKKDGSRKQRTLVRFKIKTPKRPTCLETNWRFQEQERYQEGKNKKEKKSEIEDKHERIDLGIVDSDVK